MLNVVEPNNTMDNHTPGSTTPHDTMLGTFSKAPTSSDTPPSSSSNQAKPKKKMPFKAILGALVLALTLVGSAAGYWLSQNSTESRSDAASTLKNCYDNTTCAYVKTAATCPSNATFTSGKACTDAKKKDCYVANSAKTGCDKVSLTNPSTCMTPTQCTASLPARKTCYNVVTCGVAGSTFNDCLSPTVSYPNVDICKRNPSYKPPGTTAPPAQPAPPTTPGKVNCYNTATCGFAGSQTSCLSPTKPYASEQACKDANFKKCYDNTTCDIRTSVQQSQSCPSNATYTSPGVCLDNKNKTTNPPPATGGTTPTYCYKAGACATKVTMPAGTTSCTGLYFDNPSACGSAPKQTCYATSDCSKGVTVYGTYCPSPYWPSTALCENSKNAKSCTVDANCNAGWKCLPDEGGIRVCQQTSTGGATPAPTGNPNPTVAPTVAPGAGGQGGASASPSPTPNVNTADGDFGVCEDGGICKSSDGQCIAIHTCDKLDSNGHCVNETPQVKQGVQTEDAQALANSMCKCVQVDVLNGKNNSCSNGHINGDISTLIGASTACPNSSASCGGGGQGGAGDTPPNNTCPVLSTSVNGGAYTSASSITMPKNGKLSVKVNYQGDFTFSAARNNAVGFICSKPQGILDITGPLCEETMSLAHINWADAWWSQGSPIVLNAHAVQNGQWVDSCQSTVNLTLTEPAPQCLSIAMSNPTPKIGDQVTFTCGEVVGAARYRFKITTPDNVSASLTATGRVSEALTISKAGNYKAQCQICTGTDDASCLAFE